MDVPNLKQKEKERRKSGFFWGFGRTTAAPLNGTVAATAARSAAAAAAGTLQGAAAAVA